MEVGEGASPVEGLPLAGDPPVAEQAEQPAGQVLRSGRAVGGEEGEGVGGEERCEAVDGPEPRSQPPDHLGVVAAGAGGGEDSFA